MKKLGKKELSIISYLRRDGRMTLKSLGRATRTPISTVFERLKHFRKTGLIRPTVLLNFDRLGFTARLLVALKVDREIRNEVEDYLAENMNVNTVYRVNNGFSILIDCVFLSLQDAEVFLENLDQFKLRKKMVFYLMF